MNILALDNGSRSGWASEINGQRESGVQCFGVHPSDTPGWRYIRFNVFLYAWKDLDLVVMERPLPNHKQRATAEIAFGFSTRVEEYCARRNVRLMTVHNATLKKWSCGKGNGTKEDMLRAAQQQLGIKGAADDNEIDALFLLHFALESLRRKAS